MSQSSFTGRSAASTGSKSGVAVEEDATSSSQSALAAVQYRY